MRCIPGIWEKDRRPAAEASWTLACALHPLGWRWMDLPANGALSTPYDFDERVVSLVNFYLHLEGVQPAPC